MKVPTNSYWNGKGKYQELGDALQKLIPREGACESPRSKNKALDKYRRASNVYYDLFNNGLCNRKAEFKRMFPTVYVYSSYGMYNQIDNPERLEEAIDAIILKAAIEQGIG